MTQSFDDWYRDTRDITAKSGWDAGAASRQAEIDELQKRIDDAMRCMEQNKPSLPMDFKHAMDALSILKGKQDD